MKLIGIFITIQFIIYCGGWYLPGIHPVEFFPGEDVELKVNRLTSVHTQLPYKYYSLPFCSPDSVVEKTENLGEILRGDLIENSPFQLKARVNQSCTLLCTQHYGKESIQKFIEKMKYDYRVNWIVDNLPAAISRLFQDKTGNAMNVYEIGFPIGRKIDSGSMDRTDRRNTYLLNNHVNLKLLYHTNPNNYEGIRIVGFEVEPHSIRYPLQDVEKTCAKNESIQPLILEIPEGEERLTVPWTYSVAWELSSIRWTDRWDKYLQNTDSRIHWFAIINSMMIVLFLTGMVAMIMMRTLHADFRRYNQIESREELEETGWKLVHGDVFRTPPNPQLLSVLAGSGIQVLGMVIITMIIAALGFASPANRSGLINAGVALFIVTSLLSGFTSTRTFKMFRGKDWKRVAMMTSLFLPGVVFGTFLFLNLVIWGQKSSGVVPLGTMLLLILLWFIISVPLVYLGSYFAYMKPSTEHPVRTNQYPRQIPQQVWYLQPIFSVLIGGILPFGAVFIELFFIFSAIWGQQFFYIFGFLFIVFVILVMTCAEIAVVMCYFQLCNEDYNWWWRSYLTAGASAAYMFLYSIFYFFTKLEIHRFASILLYFGYSFVMSFVFFLLTGTIGYCACLIFVKKIYGQVKVE